MDFAAFCVEAGAGRLAWLDRQLELSALSVSG
jgi:hypothetical protein